MSRIIAVSAGVAVTTVAVLALNSFSGNGHELVRPAAEAEVTPEVSIVSTASEEKVILPSSEQPSSKAVNFEKADVDSSAAVEPQYNFDQTAISSLQQTRLHGDSRGPSLYQSDWERELPTEEELADPELYEAYEQRNEEQVHRAFIAAASQRIPEIEQAIEDARAQGLDEEQLQEGVEKLEQLKAAQQMMIDNLESTESES